MPMKGVKEAKAATKALVGRIAGDLTERTVTEILIIGAGYASILTPVDTSLLINSQYRQVAHVFGATFGRVGYTAAYAAAVNAASGKLKGQPRADFGGGTGVGNYWDPGGEPDFLRKGFERDGKADIKAAIKRGMKL